MVDLNVKRSKCYKKAISSMCVILLLLSTISTQVITFNATTTNILIEDITFDKVYYNLYVGETNSLELNISPSNATDKSIDYSSSNTDVLTVNKSGEYTAISPGYAYIYCTANDDSKTQSEILIMVGQKDDIVNPVEDITIYDVYSTYEIGDVDTFKATVSPNTADDRSKIFVSTDYDVADISKNGFFKAVGVGTATIYCVAQDGSEVYDAFDVTVTPTIVYAQDISLSNSSVILSENDTHQLNATISPENTTNKNITYSSDNTKVATVSKSGVITAVSPGAAFISASTTDGSNLRKSCMVIVEDDEVLVSDISLNKSSVELEVGKTTQYTYTISPTDATNKDVTFKSSNTNVATVSSNGLVTAIASGTATITCTAKDGSNISDTSTVKVVTPQVSTKVTLKPTSTKIYTGNHSYLNPTITPSNAKVSYSSSNTSVATVDSNGIVTGKKAGTVTISAKDSNSKVVDKTTIQVVTQSSNSFSISNTSTTIPVDKSVYVRSYGSNTTFTSSNTSIATVDKNKGYVYGKSEGIAIITAKSGSVVRTCVVKVTAAAPVRFAYTSPNSATLNDTVSLYAITDNKKTSVKFIVDIDGVSKTVTASSRTTDDNGNYIWKGSIVVDDAGEFDVKAYSKTSSSSSWSTCSDGTTSIFVSDASTPETASFDTRRPSDEVIEFNAMYEGFLSEVTDDPLVTYAPTLGHGKVIVAGETFYNNISRDEAYAYLVETMNEDVYASSVNDFMHDNNIKYAQQHFDALVMFVYNVGPGALYNDDVYDILTDCVESTGPSNSTTAYVNAPSGLNLREGPGTGYDIIETLSNNEKVTVISTSNKDWYKVKTSDGTVGYCSSDYLKYSSTEVVRNMYRVDEEALQDELTLWVNAGGSFVWGLLYRRIDELEIFCYNDYILDGSKNKYNIDY